MTATQARLERIGDSPVARIILDGPTRRNTIACSTFEHLSRIFTDVAAAADLRVVVITGADQWFCAGADLNDVVEMTATEFRRFAAHTVDIFRRITELPQIVIAAVNGHAYGAGCALVMAADLVVSVRNARFAQPEINVGIVGGAALLPRRLNSYATAAEMVLLGRSISAEEAYKFGLVGRLVDEDPCLEAMRIADELLAKPKGALALAKQALVRCRSVANEVAAFDLQQDLAALSRTLPESRAAAELFLQSRKSNKK